MVKLLFNQKLSLSTTKTNLTSQLNVKLIPGSEEDTRLQELGNNWKWHLA